MDAFPPRHSDTVPPPSGPPGTSRSSRVRTPIHLLLVLSLGVGVLLVPVPALALPGETPDNTWQTNGQVRDIAKVGQSIFIGGDFTELRENPMGQGGDVIEVNNFAALDAITGAPLPVMRGNPPDFTGTGDVVNAMTFAGGKLWVGGKFANVDGARRFNIAAVDPVTLALDGANPRMSGVVFSLASDATKIYAGGKFLKVNGISRTRLAALSLNGTLNSGWTPSANDRVADMALTPDGTGLFVTGDFKSVAGSTGSFQARNAIAKLGTATGGLLPWSPGGGPYSLKIRGTGVNTVGTRVYWAVAQSDWAGAFHVDSGNRLFKTDTDGTVNDVVEMGDRVIIGGHFLLVAPQPQSSGCATNPETCDRHIRIAALTLNGVLDQSWNAKLQGDGAEWQGAKRFLVDGNNLWIGGAFIGITGEPQNYFGRLS
jgi:trimeric autotransporter adhesin